MDVIITITFVIGIVFLFISVKNNNIPMLFIAIVLFSMAMSLFSVKGKKQEPAQDLPKPPNYDKEALLDLVEQGECIGGTIHEGKFSIFICKEKIKND